MSRDRDVIVVGGGPAGAAASTLLARKGHDVLLLERENFPRFRIGESLMPATYWTLEAMGAMERLEAGGFVEKGSVQFFNKRGRAAQPFYFEEVEPGRAATTWQVNRADFDRILLENAAEKGVEVRHGVSVTDVLTENGRAVGVKLRQVGHAQEIRARVIVDATGQNALLATRLGLKQVDPKLQHASIFTRYTGARRDEGRDAGATLIMHTQEARSWFWFIPLPDGITSVGVVGHIDHLLKGRQKDPQIVFDEELDACPALQERLENASRLDPASVLRDFSYAARQIAGDGWVLAGDAFGFLDPIYSSGVFLALKGGEMAAASIHNALTSGDLSAARLGQHGPEFVAGMESLRRLVYAYYDEEFSFARFLKAHPEAREDLVHLLIGNIYRKPCTDIRRAMEGWSRPEGYTPLSLPAPETA